MTARGMINATSAARGGESLQAFSSTARRGISGNETSSSTSSRGD